MYREQIAKHGYGFLKRDTVLRNIYRCLIRIPNKFHVRNIAVFAFRDELRERPNLLYEKDSCCNTTFSHLVHRVLSKHYRPAPGGTGPSWLSFIGHTKDSLWSVDFFRCESIVLRSYWVLVVMDQFTRRLVGVGVHRGAVNGADLCRMFNAAIHGRGTPRHLSTDHDPLFEAHRWTANLRILEIDEIKTVPQVPLSHPFVERLIGTMRREFLDHVLFWNSRDLERKLADFQAYYNAARGHASLEGHTPLAFDGGQTVAHADLNHVRWVAHCRDLVQLPVAA